MIRVKEFKEVKKPIKANTKRMLDDVYSLSKEFGWNIVAYHERTFVLNLIKDGQKMNIYLSTRTVQTAINHPKSGKTQLNRKNVTPNELRKIFADVRSHTGKGYYKK